MIYSTLKMIVLLVLFVAAAFVVDQYVLACSGNPKNVVGTVPYADPNLDVITWDNELANILCQQYGRCGVAVIRESGTPPDNAVLVSWQGNKYDQVWDCDITTETHCWITGWTADGWPITKCTFGACYTSPIGQ